MIEVVAALIQNQEGKILICRRPKEKHCGLLWEFPGGKIEAGESPKAALIRECEEELDIEIKIVDFFGESTHHYPDIDVHLSFYTAVISQNQPKNKEHEAIIWVFPKEMDAYTFCPGDKEIIKKIKMVLI